MIGIADQSLVQTCACDVTIFVAASVLVLGVALLAAFTPLRRALRVDPTIALRVDPTIALRDE